MVLITIFRHICCWCNFHVLMIFVWIQDLYLAFSRNWIPKSHFWVPFWPVIPRPGWTPPPGCALPCSTSCSTAGAVNIFVVEPQTWELVEARCTKKLMRWNQHQPFHQRIYACSPQPSPRVFPAQKNGWRASLSPAFSLVGGPGPPLWKIWVRQLGWWQKPNISGKMPNKWQPFTTHQLWNRHGRHDRLRTATSPSQIETRRDHPLGPSGSCCPCPNLAVGRGNDMGRWKDLGGSFSWKNGRVYQGQ